MERDSSNFLPYSKWIDLPEATRVKIAGMFGIPRTLEREVFGNKVVQDGFSAGSLGAITIDEMQKLLHTTEKDFYSLFRALVEFVENPVQKVETPVNVQQEKQAEVVAPAKSRAGRKPKARD